MTKVYLSATRSDLKDCLDVVYRTLRKLQYDVIAMEDDVATDERPLDKCLRDVRACDLYVGVFAWRYGYVPAKDNPEHRSITELEYRCAISEGKPRLIFLQDENAPWTPALMDANTGKNEGGARIRRLREELARERIVSFFRSPDDLGLAVTIAVQKARGAREHERPTTAASAYDLRAENFRIEYLGTPDHPVPFGGRAGPMARLDAWLAGVHAPPYLLLAAPAGRGKSALLVRWSEQLGKHSDLAVVFVPVSIRYRTNLASVVFAMVTERLAAFHGETVKGAAEMSADLWRSAMLEYLARPLPDGRRLVLVLDGVDEAADWEAGRDLLPVDPPRDVRVVLSARYLTGDVDASAWLQRLGWGRPGLAEVLELPVLTKAGITEVLAHMGFPLAQLGERVDIVAELFRLSEGDPLLVRLYVEDLWSRGESVARLEPSDLRGSDPGLDGYFSRWWQDQRRLWGEKEPLREPASLAVLNILACALGPLRQEDILALAPPEVGLSTWTLEQTMEPFERFVVGDGRDQGYTFSHPRLGMYFYEQLTRAERHAHERRFVDWGKSTSEALNQGDRSLQEASDYVVQYLGAHLERAGSPPEDYSHLVNDGWRRKWYRFEGAYSGFSNDLSRAWRAFGRADAEAAGLPRELPYVGDEIRCALCQASIRSLAKNIPVGLASLLVSTGFWKPAQALANVRQIPDSIQRLRVLAVLSRYLSEPLREDVVTEVVSEAVAIKNNLRRARVLVSLLATLPGHRSVQVLAQTLRAAAGVINETRRDELLSEAIDWAAASGCVDEALGAAQSVTDPRSRSELLTRFLPHLSAARWLEIVADALNVAAGIADERLRVEALSEAVVAVSQASAPNGAQGTCAPDDASDAVDTLTAALPRLSPATRLQALEGALLTVRDLDGQYRQPDVLVQVVAWADRCGALGEVLQAAEHVRDAEMRAGVLTRLLSLLPVEARHQAVDAALRHAHGLNGDDSLADALTRLLPYLPEDQKQASFESALRHAERIGDEPRRGDALCAAVLSVSRAELPDDALESTEWGGGDVSSFDQLRGSLSQLPASGRLPALEGALLVCAQEADRDFDVPLLACLARWSAESDVADELLTAAERIARADSRCIVLSGLLPYLPPSCRPRARDRACREARLLEEGIVRARVLLRLVPHFEGARALQVLDDALREGESVWHDGTCVRLLVDLLPELPRARRLEFLRDIVCTDEVLEDETTGDRDAPSDILGRVVSSTSVEEVRDAAREMDDPERVAKLLTRLLRVPSEDQRRDLLEDLLRLAERAGDDASSVAILTALVPELPPARRLSMIEDVLRRVDGIEDDEARETALAQAVGTFCGSYAPTGDRGRSGHASSERPDQEALGMLLDSLGGERRLQALEGALLWTAATHDGALPWTAAMDDGAPLWPAVPNVEDEGALPRLVAWAKTAESVDDVLEAADSIRDEWSRAHVLNSLRPHLPEQLGARDAYAALRSSLEVEDGYARTPEQLRELSNLPEARRRDVLAESLRFVARAKDYESSEVLSEVIHWAVPTKSFGEVLQAANAIQDTDSRATAYVALMKKLDELYPHADVFEGAPASQDARTDSALEEALKSAQAIRDEYACARVLVDLIPELPQAEREPLTREVLRMKDGVASASQRAELLAALLPHLAADDRGACTEEFLETVPKMRSRFRRAVALAQAAAGLPTGEGGEMLMAALVGAREIADDSHRARALVRISIGVPQPESGRILREALATTRAISDRYRNAVTLMELAPHWPEADRAGLLDEAAARAREIESPYRRAEVLAGVAAMRSDGQSTLDEVRAIAARAREAIGDEERRAEVLASLARRFIELGAPAEALALVRSIEDEGALGEALVSLAACCSTELDPANQYRVWSEIMHGLAGRGRRGLLSAIRSLLPMIAAIGGPTALRETGRAIRHVERWWP